MKQRLITIITLLNVVVFGTAVVGLFSALGRRTWFMYLWLGAVVFNAVTFLIYYRHAHRNVHLTESRRNLWEIILFVGLPITPLIYLQRHMFRHERANTQHV